MFLIESPITIEWLAKKLGLTYKKNSIIEIIGVSSFEKISLGILAFSTQNIKTISNGIVIGMEDNLSENLIISSKPRLDFIRALEIINEQVGFKQITTPPFIPSSVKLGRNVVIENGVSIGDNTIIEHNVVIATGSTIGSNCLIRANASIGSDGFGFERAEDGTPIRFIHLGGVEIGNNVEIGANTCIAKGTLGNTVLEDNVKVDNLVHISHNCHVQKGAFIIASSVLCGGVTVGENVWVAPNATVSQKLSLGEKSIIGLGAVVTKSVENKTVVAGNPARILRKID